MKQDEVVVRGYVLGVALAAQTLVDLLKPRVSATERKYLEHWGPQLSKLHFEADVSDASGDRNFYHRQVRDLEAQAAIELDAAGTPLKRREALEALIIAAELKYLLIGINSQSDLKEHFERMWKSNLTGILLEFAKEVKPHEAIVSFLRLLNSYTKQEDPVAA